MCHKLFWKYLEQGRQKTMIYIAIKECRGCFLPESEKLLFRRNWQGLRESLLCFLAERCHNALCNADILGLVWAKGGFFQRVRFIFQIYKSSQWKYSKKPTWAWNLDFSPITVYYYWREIQISNSGYFFWNMFFLEIWRF